MKVVIKWKRQPSHIALDDDSNLTNSNLIPIKEEWTLFPPFLHIWLVNKSISFPGLLSFLQFVKNDIVRKKAFHTNSERKLCSPRKSNELRVAQLLYRFTFILMKKAFFVQSTRADRLADSLQLQNTGWLVFYEAQGKGYKKLSLCLQLSLLVADLMHFLIHLGNQVSHEYPNKSSSWRVFIFSIKE